MRSRRRLQKTNTSPENTSRPITLRTAADSPSKDFRRSVAPAARKTRIETGGLSTLPSISRMSRASPYAAGTRTWPPPRSSISNCIGSAGSEDSATAIRRPSRMHHRRLQHRT
jgi:hypothetical protein